MFTYAFTCLARLYLIELECSEQHERGFKKQLSYLTLTELEQRNFKNGVPISLQNFGKMHPEDVPSFFTHVSNSRINNEEIIWNIQKYSL